MQPSTERIKGMSYNYTFSENSIEKKLPIHTENPPLVSYLNERIKLLEAENNQLKKEITLKSSDKQTTEYYLRLRRDFFEEAERNKRERITKEEELNTEIEKLKSENSYLTKRILNLEQIELKSTREEDNNIRNSERINKISSGLKNAFVKTSSSKTSGKYFQNIYDNEFTSNFSEENFLSSPYNFPKDNAKDTVYFQSTFPNTVVEDNKESQIKKEENNPNSNNKNAFTDSQANHYILIISDLEERLKIVENFLKEREKEIESLNEVKLINISEFEREKDNLKMEIEKIKGKYLMLLSSKKSMSEEYQVLLEKQIENYKIQSEKTIYELEKKIINLEKHNENYENEMHKLSKISSDAVNEKQAECEIIKTLIRSINDSYEQVYKNYEENLKSLTKQMDSMRQLYTARENEFINLTNYYLDTINDYSKPITENTSESNVRKIEENYVQQTIECNDLKHKLENFAKEISRLHTEIVDTKSNVRQKVSEAMRNYDENIEKIITEHSNLENKLHNIFSFMNNFEDKFNFFNTLIEDKKKLEGKVDALECEMRMNSSENKDKEIFSLKEEIVKLQKEIELKNSIIKEIEEGSTKTQDLEKTFSLRTTKKVKDTVPEETITKLRNEITILSSQVTNLNKTKDSIERFYQIEIGNLFEKIKEKNEKLDEFKSIIKKMDSDFAGKKETVYNLWMLEFKEFKENLISIAEIKDLIARFKISGEELTEHKDRIYNEELYLLRQEMKIKDDLVNSLKQNFENERKNLVEVIDSYKKTIDSKVSLYEEIVNQKKKEFAVLKNEKERLKGIEIAKAKVKYLF